MIYRCSILFFIAAVMGLASCKNNDEVFPNITYTNLNVVNASADTLNFYLNGTRQNNSSYLYPTGQSLYLVEPSGLQSYQFKNLGAFSVLFSAPYNLQGNSINSIYWSMFVGGPAAGSTFVTNDVLNLNISSSSDSIEVKIVNASPSLGNLDFYVGDTVNYKSVPFKGASGFYETGSGIKYVSVYQSGSTTPLIDTPITFQPGASYTIFSTGQLKGKGTAAFNVGVSTDISYVNTNSE